MKFGNANTSSHEEYIRDPDSHNLQSQYLESTNLDGLEFAGIVEEYDRSIHKLSSILGVSFESATPKNVNSNKQQDYEIDSQTEKLILKHNDIDYELYRRGPEKLNG